MANTFQQTLANVFTPNDGTKYVDGKLVDNSGNAVDDSNATVGNDGSVFSGSNNVVSNISSGVSNAVSGIKNDIYMGAMKLTMDDDEFLDWAKSNNLNGQDFLDRTAVTSKIMKAVQAGDPTGLTDEELFRYNHMMDTGSDTDGTSMSELSEVTGIDVDGEGTEEELSYAEQVLQWATETGVIQKQEDIKAIIADPMKWMSDNKFDLKSAIPSLDADAAGTSIDANANKFKLDDLSMDPAIVDANNIATVDEVTVSTPVSYDVTSAYSGLTDNMMADAVTGEVTKTVDAEEYTVDLKGKATGINADGSVDYTGQALNNWAAQDFTNIIDTSTPAGREVARQLGKVTIQINVLPLQVR